MTAQRGAREELAEALVEHRTPGIRDGYWRCICGEQRSTLVAHQQHVADALLPVVERMAAQKAADELRDAAAEESAYDFGIRVADRLRARADALDPKPTAAPSCQAPYTEGSYTWLCLQLAEHGDDVAHFDSAGHRW